MFFRHVLMIVVIVFAVLVPSHSFANTNSSPKIVLITIDGVRLFEIINGTDPTLYKHKQLSGRELLPNFYQLFADHGTIVGRDSEVNVSNNSFVSMPGYTEIISGSPPPDNCVDNNCDPKLNRSIFDLVAQAKHSSNIGIVTSWNALCRLSTSHDYVLNCGRGERHNWNYPDNKTFHGEFDDKDRPDTLTEQAAILYYNKAHPDFLWIGIQDMDSYAHYHSYDGYIRSLQSFDKFLGEFSKSLDEGTTVIISTDHSRGHDFWSHGGDPLSKRVWLALYGANIQHKGFVKLSKTITSSFIYSIIQSQML